MNDRRSTTWWGCAALALAPRPELRPLDLLHAFFAAIGMRDNLRAREVLIAVDVVAVVMRIDDVAEGLVAHLSNRGNEVLRMHWRR